VGKLHPSATAVVGRFLHRGTDQKGI